MEKFYPKVALIGIPYDQKSSFLQGAALAPNLIRATLHNGASNYFSEQLINPIQDSNFEDLGDLEVEKYFDIESGVKRIINTKKRILTIGGNHSITYPIIKAHAEYYENLQILQIDAHADLYDELLNDKYSHACPFARIMENQLAERLVQLGIRTLNPHQKEQANKYGVEIIDMIDFDAGTRPKFDKPLYISLDLDGIDPAFAPGVSHHEPGGLTSREVIRLIQEIDVPIIGADIVEYNPHRDISGITAALAAKLLKEIACKMISNHWK